MLIWIILVAVFAYLWASMWKRQFKMFLGVLIGIPVGWLFADSVQHYLTSDMEEVPLWLPPLPFAIAATLLIVVGLIVTLTPGNDKAAPPSSHDDKSH